MKILIGTPIHNVYDQKIKEWLKAVSKLENPLDLLMVDTSPGYSYLERVKGYCEKIGIKNYEIKHLEIHQENGAHELVGRSREAIRQHLLSHDYDAWFSWEYGNIPKGSLDKLSQMVELGKFDVVSGLIAEDFSIDIKNEPNDSLQCTLIKKDILKKYGFLLEYKGMPNVWHKGGRWFKKRLIKDGGRYNEVLLAGGKIGQPLPHKDDSLEEIVADNNLICYYSQAEWKIMKKEFIRVLKVGGRLEIIFLDFDYLLKEFLKSDEKDRWTKWWPKIFGEQKNQQDFTKNGFTFERLVSELSEEGMVGFERKKTKLPYSVCLTCFKYKKK